ncbi:MAG: HlyD family secretion protein [Salinisphaera sp.]|jgi:membrane fusion protein (multidrug efflux system)|nr:HlyD family secretion protein [Salinisphaera sp.]
MAEHTQEDTSKKTHQRAKPRRHPFKLTAIVVVSLLVVVWLAFWLYHRMTHVSGKDAQVASHVITISSRLDGRVTGFNLIEGDQLKNHQLIAQLYSQPDRLKLDQLKARIADIQTRLDLAQKQIGGGVRQTQSMLAADMAGMHAAKARMDKAQDNYRRAENLYKAHGGTQKQRDIYRFDYQSAQADYQRAQTQVDTDKIAIANAHTGLLPGGQITNPNVLKSQLKVAHAELAHQQNMIDDLAVRSPIKGVVDKTFIEQDEYVSAGQPIVMMHDPDDVWIAAKMKETKVHDLLVGQPVQISVDARPDTHYSGHVQVIGDAATNQFALLPDPNPSGNFTKITQRIPVRIAIDHGPKPLLAPGMMVEVDIDITSNGKAGKRQQKKPAHTSHDEVSSRSTSSHTSQLSATPSIHDVVPRSNRVGATGAAGDRFAKHRLRLSPASQLD